MLDWEAFDKLSAWTFDSILPGANLLFSWSARRMYSRHRLQTLKLRMLVSMKSFAKNGGWIDALGTMLYLSRIRQGMSTISKKRRHWLTEQSATSGQAGGFLDDYEKQTELNALARLAPSRH